MEIVMEEKVKDNYLKDLKVEIKIVALLTFSIFLGFISSYRGMVLGMATLLILLKLGGVKLNVLIGHLKLVASVVVSILLVNLLILSRGDLATSLILFKLLGITLFLVFLVDTTTLAELGNGIEYLLNPLNKIGVPANEISIILILAIRFIPEVKEEMDDILTSQICRGIDIEGGTVKKIKVLLPLGLNIFILTLRKSFNIAMAMDARGYKDRKVIVRKKKIVAKDLIFLLVIITVCITMISI